MYDERWKMWDVARRRRSQEPETGMQKCGDGNWPEVRLDSGQRFGDNCAWHHESENSCIATANRQP